MGAIFALIAAAAAWTLIPSSELPAMGTYYAAAVGAVAILFIALSVILSSLSWSALQRQERECAPGIAELLRRDFELKLSQLYLVFFFLSSLALLYALPNSSLGPTLALIWLVMAGVALDLLLYMKNRISHYLDSSFALTLLSKVAHSSARAGDEAKLCEQMDALFEFGSKALLRGEVTLCRRVVDELQSVIKHYLDVAKGIPYQEASTEGGALHYGDKVSFTTLYFLERAEWLYRVTLEKRVDFLLTSELLALAKIALYGSKYDITIGALPLRLLGRLARESSERDELGEVADRAFLTLFEVGRSLPSELDLKYLEIDKLYITLIGDMHKLARASFSRDKSQDIALLQEPFRELKVLFSKEPLADHRDAKAIITAIDRILEEFAALETVMRTMPPPNKPDESSLSRG